jgi:nifR3 family TIM-barrel protein
MAGFTDYPFRLLAREFGADEVVTELVSANAIVRNNVRTFKIMRLHEDERPASIQLFGSDPGVMAEAAVVAEKLSPLFIDINMGCPVRKVTQTGSGSALLETPEVAGKIIKSVVDAVKTPVSIKIRTGKSGASKSGLVVALHAADCGVKRITVHARTVADGFNGPVNHDFVADLKKRTNVEIIGNGGINSLQDARFWLERTGCDGLMVGRGAIGRPSLFRAIREEREDFPQESIGTVLRHIELMEKHLGDGGLGPMRGHLIYYSKGYGNARSFRKAILSARSFGELRGVVREYMENLEVVNG